MSPLFANRGFVLYWAGVVLSQVGTRGAVAASLFQVYRLSGSLPVTGLVGAAQATALVLLGPIGGVLADRWDRRRLLQAAQGVALLVALALGMLSLSGQVAVWQVVTAVGLTAAATTFDQPARTALIPALVPEHQLAQAFALLNPSRELAVLAGPALAGLLIALGGPGLVYLLDAATYGVLVVGLAFIRVAALPTASRSESLTHQLAAGFGLVRRRRMVWMLISLDLAATVFSSYRVVLPALALDRLHIGPSGFGLLAAAPSAGALLVTYVVFRVVGSSGRLGRVLLFSTVAYGLAAVLLAQAGLVVLAVLACLLLGAFDAIATTIRQAAVQLETPHDMRGRVTALYQMASRGGPAVGNSAMGAAAGSLGPGTALAVGGVLTVAFAVAFLVRPNPVRGYLGVNRPT